MRDTRPAPYVLAFASVAVAVALQSLLGHLIGDRQPYVTFYLAIMVAARWGGLRPALFAVFLGLLSGLYFVTVPDDTPFDLDTDEIVLSIAYLVFGPLIALFVDGMGRAQRRAVEAKTEAQRSAEAVHASERRIQRLVESSIIGIVFWEESGEIREANQAFLRMAGRHKDDLRRSQLRWTELVAADCLPAHVAALDQIRTRGECDPFESALVRADGVRVPILCGGVSFEGDATRGVTFIVDITERSRVQAELEEKEARFRTLFEDSPVILIEEDWSAVRRELATLRTAHGDVRSYFEAHPHAVWDHFRKVRVVRVNRAGRDLLLLPLIEDEQPDLAATMSEESHAHVADVLAAVAEGQHHFRAEETFITTTGDRRVMLLQMSALPGHERSMDSVLVTLVDVTEERESEGERAHLLVLAQEARAQAEAASHAKDQFLAMLGHELRNPFAAVRNAVATARLDSTRRTRALEIAERQCDQLGRLIDDLLDVARISQARINLRKERIALAPIIRRAVDATLEIVEERGHHLELALPLEDIHVEADPARLEQVVVNLLTNAAKYTEPGGRIDLSVARDGAEAVVLVRDTGVGIAADVLPSVFELFTQGERTLDRAQGGLGIGLTLVRRIVELHGGRVIAHSDGIGKGAEFEVRIPAFAAPPAELIAVRSAVRSSRAARIVAVDDNADAAETLLMLLEVLGHSVRVFHDGIAALDSAIADPPDVMLVDIGLPGIDGYEVARRARREPRLSGVKLVALTGYGMEEDKQKSKAAGFDVHLVKPVDASTLEKLVARLGGSDSDEPVSVH